MRADQLPDPALAWPVVMPAVLLCADKEQGPGGGVALKAYRCQAGRWTCGWGETADVGPTTEGTKAYWDARFCDSLSHYAGAVKDAVQGAPTSANELGALTVFCYNVGIGAFQGSSVLKAHLAGDKLAASRAFGLWNKYTDPATGKKLVSRGLTLRRAQESALYLTLDADRLESQLGLPEPVPQAVEGESSLAASPIAQGGVVTATSGGLLGVVAAFGDSLTPVLAQVRAAADALGLRPMGVLAAGLLLVGAYVVYSRFKQRSQGWA